MSNITLYLETKGIIYKDNILFLEYPDISLMSVSSIGPTYYDQPLV